MNCLLCRSRLENPAQLTLQSSLKTKLEVPHETPSQSTLPDSPLSILLRQGSDFKEQDEHGSWESVASTIPNTHADIGRSVRTPRCGS